MTNNRKNRLPSDEVQADRNALQGLQTLADYAPANGAYSLHTLTTLGEAMEEARNAEVRAMHALAAARAATTAAEWALHEGILGARAQVVARQLQSRASRNQASLNSVGQGMSRCRSGWHRLPCRRGFRGAGGDAPRIQTYPALPVS